MGFGSVFKAITSIAKNPKILSFFAKSYCSALVTTLSNSLDIQTKNT
jgi:hypothetical protein